MASKLLLLLVVLTLPLFARGSELENTELKTKADAGDSSSQIALGIICLEGGDFDAAESWYLKALKGGDKDAEEYLANFYDYLDNPKNDPEKAFKWRRLVAERGDSNSQSLLGDMYHQGNGVKQSDRDAASWYRKAAEQGSAGGASSLSHMYSLGLGVRQDDVEAYVWAKLSEEWQKQSRDNMPEEVKVRFGEIDNSASEALAAKLSESKLRRAETQVEKLLAEISAQWVREFR